MAGGPTPAPSIRCCAPPILCMKHITALARFGRCGGTRIANERRRDGTRRNRSRNRTGDSARRNRVSAKSFFRRLSADLIAGVQITPFPSVAGRPRLLSGSGALGPRLGGGLSRPKPAKFRRRSTIPALSRRFTFTIFKPIIGWRRRACCKWRWWICAATRRPIGKKNTHLCGRASALAIADSARRRAWL